MSVSSGVLESRKFADLELSSLMLGTVQFGLPYGIANRIGQPTYESVRDILARACEGGVNCLDTAAGYGTSEEVIGRALRELGIADGMVVVTKTCHIGDDSLSSSEVNRIVEESVSTSLRRLKLDALPVCLFHLEADFKHVDALVSLKDRGLVRHIGCSVMTPAATISIIKSGLAEAVQVPANILDHRFTRSGVFEEARKRGVGVFVRSVYLQGLILMAEEEVPAELAGLIPARRELERIAAEAGMSLAELAIRYPLSMDGTTSVLVGIETVEQLQENLKLFARGPLSPALAEAVEKAASDLPDSLVNPHLWPKW